MNELNSENLFIRLSSRIRKQLEIHEEKDKYSYYEALGLNRDFSPDDLTRSINRSRELLERLKFHTQYKDEALSALQTIYQAAEILNNPVKKIQYDTSLQTYYEKWGNKERDKFRYLVEITLQGEQPGPEQKKSLLSYAIQRKIEIESARSILDSFGSQDQDSPLLLASPPHLTAPIPRFMDTPAFQIILQKSEPLLTELSRLGCSGCGKENPITHLICSCGSLMRGKMICLGCAFLFSITDSQCPSCGKESRVMLELTEEDLLKIYKNIQIQIDRREIEVAMNTCRNLLEILPGEQKIRTILQDLQQKHQAQEVQHDRENLETQGIRAWEEKKAYKAYTLLNRASKSGSLPEKTLEILKQASLLIASRIMRLSHFFLSLSIILLILLIISFTFDIIRSGTLYKVMLYGFPALFILGLALRIFNYFFKKRTQEKSTGSKSSHNPSSHN